MRGITLGFILLFSAPALALDFGLNGHYRFRSELSHDLDTQTHNRGITHDNDRFGMIQFNQMRLRMGPIIKVNDFLSVHSEFDILDNVMFGTNTNKNMEILSPVVGTLTLPSGSGTIGQVGGVAGENAAIEVRRAWMDILTPIGKFRLGRQPSHWGLGIFANDGDSRQGDFGDNVDRILYLAQIELQRNDALTIGLAWDVPFEAGPNPRVQGLGGTVRDNGQDTKQFAGILLYEQPDFTLGTLSGVRLRSGSSGNTMTATDAKGNVVASGIDGNTTLGFADLYGRAAVGDVTVRTELAALFGKITTGLAIDAIPFSSFSSSGSGAGIIQLPAKQTMRAFLAALEIEGIHDWGGEWLVRSGYASGDDTPLSTRVTQYGFRPDYQIAMMMFHRPIGSSPSLYGGTASNTGTSSKLTGGVPITGNFINNALYLSLGYKHKLDVTSAIPHADWFKIGGNVTTAWAPKKNVSLDFATLLNNGNLPTLSENAGSVWKRWYGVEFDFGIEASFFENLFTNFELGLLIPGKEYNIDVNPTDPGNIIDTIPVDKASPAVAARLTAMIEF
ncbi:MAG: hypothetical protein Q7S68_02720 [Deltaproteobacteria bacterium]|nr:hypothetical protein [Deltaproteobacteria bacterium]